jgi:hypothetical protein
MSGEVSSEITEGKVVLDENEEFIDHVAYNMMLAVDTCEYFEMPPELTKEDAHQVTIIISTEEAKRRYPGIENDLALSMEQLHHSPWRHNLLMGRHRHLHTPPRLRGTPKSGYEA